MRAATKRTKKTGAVLIYDGEHWLLYPDGAESPAAEAAGPNDALPREITEALLRLHVGRVRLLSEGGLFRADIPVPDRMAGRDIAALVNQEAADFSGGEVSDFCCAGRPIRWTGAADAVLLAGVFRCRRIRTLCGLLAEIGVRFDGIASLELACMLAGDRGSPVTGAALIAGPGNSLAVPAQRPRPEHEGPLPFAGGLRHAETDGAGWALRFRRVVTCFDPERPLTLLALCGSADSLATLLRSECRFREVRIADRLRVFAEAARLVRSVRVNRMSARLPAANPCVPRKRFGHAWYIVPSLLLLAAPFVSLAVTEHRTAAEAAQLRVRISEKQALRAQIDAAEALAAKAKKAHDRDAAQRIALAECRRPLSAAVQAAYFFSRYAGVSVLLQELTEKDGVVRVRGIYADPEDGLRMNADLTAYAKACGLSILKNTTGVAQDEEGMPASQFEVILDYSKMTLGGGDR